MHYLKNTEIPDSFTALGLPEVRMQLRRDTLSEQEKIDYGYYLKRNRYENDTIESSIEEGMRIGLEKEKMLTVNRMAAKGMSIEDISNATDLPTHQIEKFLYTASTSSGLPERSMDVK